MIINDKQVLIDFIHECLNKNKVCSISVADFPEKPNMVLITPKVWRKYENFLFEAEFTANGEVFELWYNPQTDSVELNVESLKTPVHITRNDRWGKEIIENVKSAKSDNGSGFHINDDIFDTIQNSVSSNENTEFQTTLNILEIIGFILACMLIYYVGTLIF